MSGGLLDCFLAALGDPEASAGTFAKLISEDVTFETLGASKHGAGMVSEHLAASEAHLLTWSKWPGREGILHGSGDATGRRGRVIKLAIEDGKVRAIWQQNTAVVPAPAQPMQMDEALRARFDSALKDGFPMALSYVDADGRPRLSLRGSIRTWSGDTLCLWARSAETGLAAAIGANPRVALLYRNQDTKATYQIDGRAHAAEDESVRQAVYDGAPPIERAHDFAMIGTALLIKLDRVEGYAGLGPGGQIDSVRLIRV